MKNLKGYALILIAGILFGTIPIFATLLNQLGVSIMEQTFFRILFSFALVSLFLFFKKINPFDIRVRDLKFFCAFGLIGIALFFGLYISAAIMTSVTVAVLLLYTQPMFTLILSRLILKERINILGILAIILALAGVGMVLNIWSLDMKQFSLGHLLGIGAGFCYSSYIIFGRASIALKKFNYLVVTFWSFFFGLLWMIPIWLILYATIPVAAISEFNLDLPLNAWALLLGFATIATLIAYSLFNKGIGSVESHNAGVLVLMEPISAIIFGVLIFRQEIFIETIIGGILILISAYIVIKTE